MPKDYGSWKTSKIRAELQKRNANANLSGKKTDLVKRLHKYDIKYGGLVNEPDKTYHIPIHEPARFADINNESNVPNINEGDLELYSMFSEGKNLTISKNMYESICLQSCRIAEYGGVSYMTASCKSDLKKLQLSYKVTIKFQKNVLLEGQCECPTGVGPYAQCPHVFTLIYGIIDFGIRKQIKCIPKQNYQPLEIYTGQPMKAEDIPVNIEHGFKYKNFNPIPDSEIPMEIYRENFKYLIRNFAEDDSSSNMSIAQLYVPAKKIIKVQEILQTYINK